MDYSMVKVNYLIDRTVSRRHFGQIHFKETSVVRVGLDSSQIETKCPYNWVTDVPAPENTSTIPVSVESSFGNQARTVRTS